MSQDSDLDERRKSVGFGGMDDLANLVEKIPGYSGSTSPPSGLVSPFDPVAEVEFKGSEFIGNIDGQMSAPVHTHEVNAGKTSDAFEVDARIQKTHSGENSPLDLKLFAKKNLVTQHKRMSVSDMKDALKHLSDVKWSKKRVPCSHIHLHMLSPVLDNPRDRRVLLAAMFHLECRHRVVTYNAQAHCFEWWRACTQEMTRRHFLAAHPGSAAGGKGEGARTKTQQEVFQTRSASTRSALDKLIAENQALNVNGVMLGGEHVLNTDEVRKLRARGSVRLLAVYMKQCVRRKLEFGFHHWLWITSRVLSRRHLSRDAMVTAQEHQNVLAKEFQLDSMLAVNATLTNAIQCSHAFFRWKIRITKMIFIEERESEAKSQRSLFMELRHLKKGMFQKNAENKKLLAAAIGEGKEVNKNLYRVQAAMRSACELSSAINALCVNGKEVPILAPSVQHTAKERWNILRSHIGIDSSAAAIINDRLETEKVKKEMLKKESEEE